MAGGIDRAREDIASGRLWKARERLLGAVRSNPHDAEALDLLGEVYFSMGDHPAAGRFWALTTRDDADARSAQQALEENAQTRRELLRALPVKPPLDAYPPEVQSRIGALRSETGWKPYLDEQEEPEFESSFLETLGWTAVIAAVLMLTVGMWLLGVIAALRWILNAL